MDFESTKNVKKQVYVGAIGRGKRIVNVYFYWDKYHSAVYIENSTVFIATSSNWDKALEEIHARNQKMTQEVKDAVEKRGDVALKSSFYKTLQSNTNVMQNLVDKYNKTKK